MYSSLLAGLVGQCLDYIEGLPAFSRQGMLENLMTAATETNEPVNLKGIFDEEKALNDLHEGSGHKMVTKIIDILDLIEESQVAMQKDGEMDLEKLEKMLKQKMDLSKEIEEFESKQKNMIYGAVFFIFVWIAFFYYCFAKQRAKKHEESLRVTPEELEKQRKELEGAIQQLDKDIARATQILKELKARN